MAVIIKELVIRVSAGTGLSKQREQPARSTAVSPKNTKAIIEECVDQVMKILDKKSER